MLKYSIKKPIKTDQLFGGFAHNQECCKSLRLAVSTCAKLANFEINTLIEIARLIYDKNTLSISTGSGFQQRHFYSGLLDRMWSSWICVLSRWLKWELMGAGGGHWFREHLNWGETPNCLATAFPVLSYFCLLTIACADAFSWFPRSRIISPSICPGVCKALSHVIGFWGQFRNFCTLSNLKTSVEIFRFLDYWPNTSSSNRLVMSREC